MDAITSQNSCSAGFSCGLDVTLRIIAGKWKPLIIYFLREQPNRYGELKRAVKGSRRSPSSRDRSGELKRAVKGVSDKVLIQQLKELEADGIVRRTDYQEVPPRVDYALTPLGRSLSEALSPLCEWGSENLDAVAAVFAEREGWGVKG